MTTAFWWGFAVLVVGFCVVQDWWRVEVGRGRGSCSFIAYAGKSRASCFALLLVFRLVLYCVAG